MHTLNVTDVTRIAEEVALEHSPRLKVVGATFGGGDSDYAEVIVDIQGCNREPCRLLVGLFRNASAEALRTEFAAQLQRHLDHHPHAGQEPLR